MDKYEPVREIEAGNFAATKLMRELVNMKFIERGNRIDENVFREIVNHRSLRHPNIIRFKEVVLTPTHLAIVMEYAAGGELFERICEAGRFHEDEARYLFQQLVCGVSFCHAMNICHRDLKLENTLLDGSPARRLKICDFVYSKSSVLHSRPKSTVGTPKYIAPEVLSRREYDGKRADVWSCGVTLYVMLVGAYPFEDPKDPKNFRKTISRILSAQYKIPEYVYVSQNCRHLLSRIFLLNPYKRITMSEIKSHPWYLENLPRELKEEAQAAYYNRRGGGDAGASGSGSSNGGGANAAAAYSSQSVEEIMRIVQEAQTVPKPAKPVSGYGSDHEDNDQYEEADAEQEEEEEEAEQVDQQRASQPADQHGTRGIPATWEDAAALAVSFLSLSIEDTSQYMSATPGILTYRLLSDITKGFSNEHKIGHGSFGEVYKGELPNGEKIAVKKLRQHLILVDDVQFKNEILILRNLKHHNIVQFVGYCHATEPVPVEINGKVILAERHQRALCFEYLQNGSLRNHLSEVSRGLNWQMRYEIIKGICEGLNYLHNGSEDGRHIYHMDLKPDNILLDENMVPKIADFGLSRLFSTTQSHTTVTSPGTPGYMPPEYIDTFKISNKFDIFSLGVIIIDIMIGPSSCRHEYDEASSDKDYSNLVQENWNRRLKATPSYTSQETDDSLKVKTCIEIALKCVKKDRVERPTISMILDTLKYIHTAQRSLLVDQARLVKFGLWGGKRGTRRDIKTAPRRLESVTIYSLDVIDALEFSYNDCNGQHHTAGPWGGAGGSPNKVQLHPSEVLVEMCGTVGPTDGIPNVITSLMLITDAGKYGPFGRGDGTPFRICMQNNGHIAGFFGRADEYVNAVGVYTNQEESRVGVCKVGPWGGEGGSTCDIDVPPHHVQSVTVRCSDHVIHSLAFSYSDRNGHHHTAGPWGGIGGEVHKIDLEPYEFLVEVSGTIGEFGGMQNLITSFTLVTNVATYGPFGEVRGTRFDIPVHSKSCIVGFFVRAGIFINAIGVYARPI